MQTTIGSLMLNNLLPEDLHDHSKSYNKKELVNLLKRIGASHPESYGEIVKKIKDLGDAFAYLEGSSFSFADLAPISTNDIFKKYQPLLNKAQKEPNKVKRLDMYREINLKIENDINERVKKDIEAKKNNRFLKWTAIGAKGGPNNIRQMFYSSGNQVDVRDQLYPHMAMKNFSEGLAPSDYFISGLGARKGIVSSFISVRDPGAFAKELYTLNNEMVTSTIDCGTRRGKELPVGSPDALDRCLLEDVGGFKRNTLVTSSLMDALKKSHHTIIKVRSPLYCEAPHGVCSMCVGLLENGKMSPVGDSVGLRSSQSMTEKLTQMALSAKHTGGVVGKRSPFETIKQLMHVPENFPGGAVLSQDSGHVDKIESQPDGGTKVWIGSTPHYLLPSHEVVVKKGDKVEKGDSLSDGLVNPKELVELKGMDAGREYLSHILNQTYKESGNNGHPKVYETVVRGILNIGKVEDPGDHPFMPDELVKWNSVQDRTKKTIYRATPDQSLGFRLHDEIPELELKKDHQVSYTDINKMKAKGIGGVNVYMKPMVVKPVMMGTERAALVKNDTLSNLGFRFLKEQLKENISLGRGSNIHSYDPIPAYVYGAEFGKGEEGRF